MNSHPVSRDGFFVSGKSNGSGNLIVNRPNAPLLMPRLLYSLLFIAAITFAACDKDSGKNEEATFYGTWVKGSNTGDTLYFYRKNGQDFMRSNQSFNPNMYAPTEHPYKYESGKLFIAYPYSPLAYETVKSFSWKTPGSQFEINGFELYMFMSSTMTKFTFTKIP